MSNTTTTFNRKMVGQTRYVYIRGYTRQVQVLGWSSAREEYLVLDGTVKEFVPTNHFYFKNRMGRLVWSDMPWFNRLFPNHPLHIERVETDLD